VALSFSDTLIVLLTDLLTYRQYSQSQRRPRLSQPAQLVTYRHVVIYRV